MAVIRVTSPRPELPPVIRINSKTFVVKKEK
jgi:hypothetical protein